MNTDSEALSHFHPLAADWFSRKVGRPTDVQESAWPRIAQGENVMVTAPTGSGKTLTAFFWAINQLITGEWPAGRTVVLYVSPLKALNNDIRRNLLGPLDELRRFFEDAGEPFPDIRVLTRSGDTPESDRRRMIRQPPEILISTPESLNLMLSSQGGRSILTGLRVVILDEIHAVVGNKRGVHLITAVDRLVLLSGDFQRLALSATVRPLDRVADFVGGYRFDGNAHDPIYEPRPVAVIRSAATKSYEVNVRFLPEALDREVKESIWEPMAEEFKRIIGRNRSTLLFANSRRLTEKLTLRINSGEERPIAYAHHGSLSREIRTEVEKRLKAGELKAIVATNSLEMGIDIGSLDEVLLIQSPRSVSSAVQRIGRAGHRVGEVSRGTIFPSHNQDILEAAVLARCVLDQDIENVSPVDAPLDVLAQIIVSMTGVEIWDIDNLFAWIKTSYPYRELPRRHFELVLQMLAGRYADSLVRGLKPRISIDRLDNTVRARKGALLALYTSGGVIPDRGYYRLRRQDSDSLIGDLDEEFVWEAQMGQTFTLGTQHWRIERITHNDVFVSPAAPTALSAPFWRAEEYVRDYHYSLKISEFLEIMDQRLEEPDPERLLQSNYRLDAVAAEELVHYLNSQRETTSCPLPHRHHLLLEHTSAGPGDVPGNQLILHNYWGLKLNRPLAMALETAWKNRFGPKIEVFAGNDSIVLLLPHEIRGDEFLSLVTSANLESLLKKRLEGSGFFGARFRECAGRALLLPKRKFNERMPLWMTRLRSQKLMDSVRGYDDFPIILETWRTSLHDEFDLVALKERLAELETGSIIWSETRTGHPSPMARNTAYRQINDYMYRTDEPSSEIGSSLRPDLLRDLLFRQGLRPTVSVELALIFEQKRKRLSPGYSPSSSLELIDWVKERVFIPDREFHDLTEAMKRDHGDIADILEETDNKLIRVHYPDQTGFVILALERAVEIIKGLFGDADVIAEALVNGGGENIERPQNDTPDIDNGPADPDELLSILLVDWLSFYGPIHHSEIASLTGVSPARLEPLLEGLVDTEKLIVGKMIEGRDAELLCDIDNYEILLRMARAQAVPAFTPLDAKWLPVFLAHWQGLDRPTDDESDPVERLEPLLCLPLPADIWEKEVLPARIPRYSSSDLDSIMQEGALRWVGFENRRVAFCPESDLDLLQDDKSQTEIPNHVPDIKDIFPDPWGRYDIAALVQLTGKTPMEINRLLWDAVWRGEVTNDTYLALRRGITTDFKLPSGAVGTGISSPPGFPRAKFHPSRMHGSRGRISGTGKTQPVPGAWFPVPWPELEEGIIEREELKKDRVRMLLDRYGIVFRDILRKESPPFQWTVLFRTLRIMELSGEVLAGNFIERISGPQFISHQAFRVIQRSLPQDRIYWFNAVDPVSLCGLGLDEFRGKLPRRMAGTHLVYRGPELVMVSEKLGKSLTFHCPANDPDIFRYTGPLRHMLTRSFQPQKRIVVETINDLPAYQSPYADTLKTDFETVLDYKNLILYRP